MNKFLGDSMKKAVVILMFLTFISKILGFTRDITLSYFFGATAISDVYIISLTIPTVIFGIIGNGISSGLIPMYIQIESNYGTKKAHYFTNNILNFVILLCLIIFIICMLFTEPIVKLFASGFVGESLNLAINFTRITMAGIFFTGIIYVLTPFLQIKRIFIITSLIGLPSNLIMIGSFFIGSQSNIYVLAFGSLIAIGSQFLLICILSYKSNYRYSPRLDFKDSNMKKMFFLALPIILGSSVSQINILIDRTLASRIVEGGISALNYASTLNLSVLGIAVSPIIAVLFPKISRMVEKGNIEEMKMVLSSSINTITLLVFPATVGFMLFADPIIQLLFGRGEFDSLALLKTSQALFFYSIGLIGLCLRELFANTFYSLHDTKTPMINATIALIINIVLNIVLSWFMGLNGLALATSIATLVGFMLLFNSLRKRIGNLVSKKSSISFLKIGFASLIMGGVSKLAYNLLLNIINQSFSLLLAIFIGGVVYLAIICAMKIVEIKMIAFEVKKIVQGISIVNKAA